MTGVVALRVFRCLGVACAAARAAAQSGAGRLAVSGNRRAAHGWRSALLFVVALVGSALLSAVHTPAAATTCPAAPEGGEVSYIAGSDTCVSGHVSGYTASIFAGASVGNVSHGFLLGTAPSSVTGSCGQPSSVNGSGSMTFDCGSGPYSFTVTWSATPQYTALTATVEVLQSGGSTSITSATVTGGLPIPEITSAVPGGGTVGTPYSHTFAAAGGTGALSFAVKSGSLPSGLSLSSSGELTGTPTAGGTFNFTVAATDSAPVGSGGPVTSAPQAVTLVISKLASTTTLTASANPSQVGEAVLFTAKVEGTPGTLPTGTFDFKDNGETFLNFNIPSSGELRVAVGQLTEGTHVITVEYSGDAAYVGGTAAVTQVVNPPTHSGLTVRVVANGHDGTFAYTTSGTGLSDFSATTNGGSASRAFTNLGAGTYTVTQGALPTGWQLDSVVCNGTPQAGGTASVTLTGLNGVTCIFTNSFDEQGFRAKTQAVIRNFMQHRAEAIASSEPQGTSGAGKLTGWLFGGGSTGTSTTAGRTGGSSLGGPSALLGSNDAQGVSRRLPGSIEGESATSSGRAAPFMLSGRAQDGDGSVQFSTSLNQLRRATAEAQAAKESGADEISGGSTLMGLGARPRARTAAAAPSSYDVWMEGRVSYFEDDRANGRQSGHTHLFYAGADYRIHPAILVGALVQFDWADESSSTLGTSADGAGWMAGPYASARLTQNLTLDARAAWGQSSNNVNPLGLYEDSFDTDRSLYSARLTGDWLSGQWRFTPSATLVYFRETQQSYMDSLSILIPEQEVKLGRLTIGPEVGYRFGPARGAGIEPFVGLKGVWDFEKDDTSTIGGFVVGNDDWHGRVEAGAVVSAPWGLSVRAAGAYEGIGDSTLKLYQGQLTISAPLN